MLKPSAILLTALAIFAADYPADAQQAGKIYSIGYMSNRLGIGPREKALRQGLHELGYVEGRNLVIEWRFTKGQRQRLGAFAAELVRLKVDCIVSSGTGTTLAVKKATSTIPVVMANVGNPRRSGIVTNLARPGGNITGFTTMSPGLAGKHLQLLKDAFPNISRVAVILEAANPSTANYRNDVSIAARALGMQHQILEMRHPDDFDTAFRTASKGGAGALIVVATSLIQNNMARIFDLEAKTKLPVMYTVKRLVPAGGLMSYGPSRVDPYRRAAVYVDRILKGAKPGDLPVERPSRFELVINLKTAKAAGITFPRSILLRTDKVIE